jgi:hypothetical protein
MRISRRLPTSSMYDKSPTDNSPQIGAGLVVGEAALILRCREQKTEAAFSTKDTYLGDKPVTVRFRINSQDPIKEVWRPSMNGLAAFAPKPEEFIRALPDSGRIFIRAFNAKRLSRRHLVEGMLSSSCRYVFLRHPPRRSDVEGIVVLVGRSPRHYARGTLKRFTSGEI